MSLSLSQGLEQGVEQGVDRCLVLLIGIPGSGKSSLAAGLQQACCTVVATDQIRAALFGDASIQGDWSLIWRQVERELQQADCRLTVYDATNIKRQARRAVIRLALGIGYNQIIGLWLNPPLALCLARNQQRTRQVPEVVIRRMHQQLWSAPPRLREGLDLLLHYGGAAWREPEDWLRQILPTQSMAQSTEIAPEAQQEPNQASPEKSLG